MTVMLPVKYKPQQCHNYLACHENFDRSIMATLPFCAASATERLTGHKGRIFPRSSLMWVHQPPSPWVQTWLTLTWWRRWSWRSWAPRCPPGWRTGRWRWTPLDLLSLLPLSWRGKRAGLVGFPLLFSLFPHQNFLALSIWHLSAFHMLKGTRNNHCCCYADNYHYHSLSIIVQKLW